MDNALVITGRVTLSRMQFAVSAFEPTMTCFTGLELVCT